jgi:hypothetical protein
MSFLTYEERNPLESLETKNDCLREFIDYYCFEGCMRYPTPGYCLLYISPKELNLGMMTKVWLIYEEVGSYKMHS